MSLWDTLFGDENVRKAMQNKAYLDPSSITDPVQKEAALSAGQRMDLSNRLGKAALAVAQANQKPGAGPGTILAAFGGGFGAGGDDLSKQQYAQAQTRGVLAQAKKHEAEAKYYGGGAGAGTPPVVRDQYGRVHRLTPKGYKPVPKFEQEGYSKVALDELPTMPTGATLYNEDQRTIDPQGAKPPGGAAGSVPTYTDTTTGKVYKWVGGKWAEA